MIIYALNERHKHNNIEIVIVTEESEATTDNKAFKKIPTICNILNLNVLTLPQLLEKYKGINIEFKWWEKAGREHCIWNHSTRSECYASYTNRYPGKSAQQDMKIEKSLTALSSQKK